MFYTKYSTNPSVEINLQILEPNKRSSENPLHQRLMDDKMNLP